ncbi:MAG: pectinesterase family protein [Acidobacteriaceae bacterium]|nr:pectinesterase family protein [Acidobacteriaceae bacterium]
MLTIHRPARPKSPLFLPLLALAFTTLPSLAQAAPPTLRVAADGSATYTTVQAAVDAAPETGGAIILIAKGTYREIVTINKPGITLRGATTDPSQTVIVDDHNAGENGGTFHSSTVSVYADDFHAEQLTIANDFNRTHAQGTAGSQALALLLQGDRAILRHVHLLGNQDTLFAGHKGCMAAAGKSCTPARSYFADCLIAGNVDFIFGDGAVVFDRCEIRSTTHAAGGYITAQSRVSPDQTGSLFVFNHCTLTAEPGVTNIFLGRPWRPYATVIYLHTLMGAHIQPAGWHEWHAGETHSLETATYAEFDSTGPGAAGIKQGKREPLSHQLTAAEAAAFSAAAVLGGSDHWNPEASR